MEKLENALIFTKSKWKHRWMKLKQLKKLEAKYLTIRVNRDTKLQVNKNVHSKFRFG